MAISYKVCKCRNPKNPDVDHFKGTAVKSSDYDFEDLADDLALATTVTKADAMAVLASIKPFIIKALLAGRRVVLNDLGSFHVSLQGKCYTQEEMNEEEFKPSEFIKSHRIVFRPEVNLKRDVARGFQLKRISSDAMK